MSQYLSWHVGMKVVCVNVRFSVEWFPSGWRRFFGGKKLTHNLVCGETYTIESIVVHHDIITNDEIVCVFLKGFRFKEKKNIGFPAGVFRPAQERKTDISCFTKLLHRVPAKEDA